MRFIQLLIVFLLCGLLSGCGHNISLMARDSGEKGTGRIPSALGKTGELTIELKSETYWGWWVYPSGGSIGLLTTYGTNPTTGTSVVSSGSETGKATLKSASGKNLRCEFEYSEGTSTGIGVCIDDNSTPYDMQIYR